MREYWLLDVPEGVLMRFQHDGKQFGAPEHLHAHGAVALQALPELKLDLDFMRALRVTEEPSPRA